MVDCGFSRACLQNGQLWQIAALIFLKVPMLSSLILVSSASIRLINGVLLEIKKEMEWILFLSVFFMTGFKLN
jgi:hypothetical protein